jgi:hypothetical protein
LRLLLRHQAPVNLLRDAFGIISQRRHNILVPDLMQAEAFAAQPRHHIIAALVLPVGGMQRLMHVGDEMNQKPQRLGLGRLAGARVTQNPRVLRDLGDDAIPARAIARRVIAT